MDLKGICRDIPHRPVHKDILLNSRTTRPDFRQINNSRTIQLDILQVILKIITIKLDIRQGILKTRTVKLDIRQGILKT